MGVVHVYQQEKRGEVVRISVAIGCGEQSRNVEMSLSWESLLSRSFS